jgi:hypothetical protein
MNPTAVINVAIITTDVHKYMDITTSRNFGYVKLSERGLITSRHDYSHLLKR